MISAVILVVQTFNLTKYMYVSLAVAVGHRVTHANGWHGRCDHGRRTVSEVDQERLADGGGAGESRSPVSKQLSCWPECNSSLTTQMAE